jgi:hypothetical protein
MLPAHAVVGDVEDTPIGNISALAVVSLLLGLASPLSLMAPLLWAIPLCGATLAIVTIRRVAASDGVLIGRQAAVIGLALSVASLCAAASRFISSEQMLSHQARAVALEWLTRLESGDAAGAFQYTTESTRAPGPPHAPGQTEPTEPPHDPVADFSSVPLIRFLTSVGKGAQTLYDKDLDIAEEANGAVHVKLQFLVIPPGASAASAVIVNVTLDRHLRSIFDSAKWYVAEYRSDNLPAPPGNE